MTGTHEQVGMVNDGQEGSGLQSNTLEDFIHRLESYNYIVLRNKTVRQESIAQ